MKRILLWVAGLVLAALAAIFVFNASWRVAAAQDPQVMLIAHRGVHQTFPADDLENDTCTAERIDPPRHRLIENTLPSMQAAFAAGADIVELDIHPTTDGALAVLHDWSVDCRTEGSGVTRELAMEYLRSLDLGYGYTPDGGASFPLRGLGAGLMPSLDEVLAAFPDGRFLVNFKSNEAREADMLAGMVAGTPGWREAIWGVYGGDAPTFAAAGIMPELAAWSRNSMIDCLLGYEALGWTGFVPEACRDSTIMLPVNMAGWLWGWPNLFLARMAEAGTEVILIGPYSGGDIGTRGIDDLETLAMVPEGFSGYLWTNRIEEIGPALGRGEPLGPEAML